MRTVVPPGAGDFRGGMKIDAGLDVIAFALSPGFFALPVIAGSRKAKKIESIENAGYYGRSERQQVVRNVSQVGPPGFDPGR